MDRYDIDSYSYEIHGESWTNEIEDLLLKWKNVLIEKYNIHLDISDQHKRSYEKETFIAVISPIIMSIIQGILIYVQSTESVSTNNINNSTNTKYEPLNNLINIILFSVLSILSYIIKSRNNGSKSANSNQHSVRCMDVVSRIELELAKPRNQRIAAIVFVQDIRHIIAQLQMSETFIM